MKYSIAIAIATAYCVLSSVQSFSQDDLSRGSSTYPTKPVRIIVPFPPGRTVDLVGRMISERLTQAFDKTFVVDNRAGASGTLGTSFAAKSPADGYTLLVVSNGTLAGNAAIYKEKLPYNPNRDFAPIINFITTPQLLIANVNFQPKTVRELVNYAKANPGKISYATPGYGTSSHLAMEMLRAQAGIDLVMVPYQGSPAAFTDIIAGRIPIMFEAAMAIIGQIRAGKVRAVATGGARRAGFLPDLPTISESGYPGFDATPWVGLVAPAGTPKDLLTKIHDETLKALVAPGAKERILELGAEPSGMNPDQFATLIRSEIERWTKVVQTAGIKLE